MNAKTGTYFNVHWEDSQPEYEGVHGHIEFDVFCAVMKQQGLPTPRDNSQLEYVYFRYIPDYHGTLDGIYIECSKGSGAFPVTVWRFPPLKHEMESR